MFEKDVEKIPTRNGFGEGLTLAGEKDERVVALCADLTESVRMEAFKEKFPERFIQVGVAEQALVTVASGMANYGKVPFAGSYAVFSPGRNWEQIRTTIALNDVPVKVVGSHAGVTVGPDGATHQALEDIALMRVMPNMVVVSPCDSIEAKKATLAIAGNGKPSYIRLCRDKTPVVTTEDTPFEVGKANILWESKNPVVTIVATGPLVYQSIEAAKKLEGVGVGSIVVNMHTIKPLDKDTIIRCAMETECVVSVEEHQVAGGLGSAVSEVLAANYPVPMELIGMHDEYGESGKPNELLKKFGMTTDDIFKACKKVMKRKIS